MMRFVDKYSSLCQLQCVKVVQVCQFQIFTPILTSVTHYFVYSVRCLAESFFVFLPTLEVVP